MNKSSLLLSIVVPCNNEEEALPFFFTEIAKQTTTLTELYHARSELIFVDDGSRDGTLGILRDEARKNENVHYISFSRNFGKEAAIYAGLKRATGDFVVLMDADLQDPPSLLPKMFHYLQSGECDSVATQRTDRHGEPPIRSFFARLFYKLINKISDTDIINGARDFRMMNRKMVDAVLSLGEYNRFSKGIFGWVGFRTKWLPYENTERVAGRTKWSFWKLFTYALQGIIAFSTAPLALASLLGLLFCVAAAVMVLFIVMRTLLYGDPVGGWPSLVCIILFIGGVQLFCVGIIGQYLSKTYLETKQRPVYITAEEDTPRTVKGDSVI